MEVFHILLIEDNKGDVLLTEVALQSTGMPFLLSVLYDGKEAFDYLDKIETIAPENMPDIILLDINLPKINGLELLKFIKQNDKLKKIPVIILTTSSSQNDVDIAYANHASLFITKPSEMDEFLNAITAILKLWSSIGNLPSKMSVQRL
jgi:CheY-like chemotaxis protein